MGNGSREFLIGVTDVRTGAPLFMRPDAAALLKSLLASSALPVLYRDFVEIQGRQVADGGVAEPLPVREAYLRGARKIVVVRTRPADASKGCFLDSLLALVFLRDYPALRARIHHLGSAYRDATAFIRHPPPDATVLEIAPQRPLRSGRLSMGEGSIEADYRQGKKAGEDFFSCWE